MRSARSTSKKAKREQAALYEDRTPDQWRPRTRTRPNPIRSYPARLTSAKGHGRTPGETLSPLQRRREWLGGGSCPMPATGVAFRPRSRRCAVRMRADRGAPGTANARPRWSIEEYCMAANIRLGSKADVWWVSAHVRFVPIPDLRAPSVEVSNRSRSVAARRGVSAGICRCGKNDQSG